MNMYLELKLPVVKSNRIHVLRSKQFRSKNCIDASVDNKAYSGVHLNSTNLYVNTIINMQFIKIFEIYT